MNEEKSYNEALINSIVEMIKTNIFIYYNNNKNYFLELRKHCIENQDKKYKNLDYYKLLYFVEEVLSDLINCEYLYDFRALE